MQESISVNGMLKGRVQGHQVLSWPGIPNPAPLAGFKQKHGESFRIHNPHTDWQEAWFPVTRVVKNTALYDAAVILANLLRNTDDGKSYSIGGMYIEFDNSGSTVSPTPTISRDGNLSGYYNGLNSSDPNRDYLRVPLTATSGSSGGSNYDGNNIATFLAQTAGTTGVHGNTFSDVANSLVYGGALVAFLDSGDSSQDLILSRFYFTDTAEQIAKVAGSQIGLTWPITLQ